MKHRHGFVSNSSSASFMVPKSRITEEQVKALLDYSISEENTDGWDIYDGGDCVRGTTLMDNDALDDYLEKIGFDFSKMEWNEF